MYETDTPNNLTSAKGGDSVQNRALTAAITSLRPINRLPKHAVDNIVKQTTLYQVSVGETIIKRVADEKLVHYLLEGAVQIFDANGESETLITSDPNAKNALGRFAKSAQDIVANCPSTLLRIPWETLEKYLIQYAPAELSSTLEVQEILSSTSSDWMVRLLQSDLFSLLPANNIQTVLSSIEFVDTLPDEIIITEGEQGEHFFIVDYGDFLVSKQNTKTGAEVELAQLSSNDFFGEEALITGAPRGATVTSLGNGRLIKINNDTFKNSIVAPAVPLLSADHAKSLVGRGASYLDIRPPEQALTGVIPNSAHLLLSLVRSNEAALDKQQTYVVIDDTPAAAAHAAFLLRAKGYDARCLNLPLQKYAVLQGIELNGEGNPALSGINAEQIAPPHNGEQAQALPENTNAATQSTLDEIDQLADDHDDLPDEAADVAEYAHTLTGVGLADLIEELNEAYDVDEPAGDHVAYTSSVNNYPSQATPTLLEDPAACTDIESIGVEHHDAETAFAQEKEALIANYELKLRQQQDAAKRAVGEHKIKLEREYRQKQLTLLENGKKLIALANKVSQQKSRNTTYAAIFVAPA